VSDETSSVSDNNKYTKCLFTNNVYSVFIVKGIRYIVLLKFDIRYIHYVGYVLFGMCIINLDLCKPVHFMHV